MTTNENRHCLLGSRHFFVDPVPCSEANRTWSCSPPVSALPWMNCIKHGEARVIPTGERAWWGKSEPRSGANLLAWTTNSVLSPMPNARILLPVDPGHEFSVGGAGGGEVFVAFVEL